MNSSFARLSLSMPIIILFKYTVNVVALDLPDGFLCPVMVRARVGTLLFTKVVSGYEWRFGHHFPLSWNSPNSP
jgi:hypothetical protein